MYILIVKDSKGVCCMWPKPRALVGEPLPNELPFNKGRRPYKLWLARGRTGSPDSHAPHMVLWDGVASEHHGLIEDAGDDIAVVAEGTLAELWPTVVTYARML